MNNGLLNLFLTKERKRYNQIINMIETKNYNALFYADQDERFGITDYKLRGKIIKRIEQEVFNSTEFLIYMNKAHYHRAHYFNEKVIKSNPKMIELFIKEKIGYLDGLIPLALELGYNPTDEYVNANLRYFAIPEIMKILINRGYKPTKEQMEQEPFITLFSDEALLKKALDWGFVPSIDFLRKTKALKNPSLTERILSTIDVDEKVLKSPIFMGNPKAQKKILEEKKEAILRLEYNDCAFEEFWIEAFKKDYIPNEILKRHAITGNIVLFSRIIRQRPELVKYCTIVEKDKRNEIDELAICMGYVPSIKDAEESKYIRTSAKLMKSLILTRPEAIKYVETRPLTGGYMLNITNIEFQELARTAINNGYIPSLKDIEDNPRLADSFEIMKIIIEDNPNAIDHIRDNTPNKEDLLKIAISKGFNGTINYYYWGTENNYGSSYNTNELLTTETAMMYQINQGKKLYPYVDYHNNYSLTLYHFMLEKGYQLEEIIKYFNGNYETMTEIINEHPEYITKASIYLSRKEIDDLAILAINKGYIPKEEDIIFGYGSEVALMMVKKYPSYLAKVNLFDCVGLFGGKPCSAYQEICKTAVDGGYMPPIEKMGDGHGDTTIVYNSSYEIMKKAIPYKPSLIETCDITDKEKYDELCRLALKYGYSPQDEYILTQWGKKLCTNVDMMARYLKINPNFILKVEITNSDEMIRLLNIAIENGFNLRSIKEQDLLKIFLVIDESKWNLYLDETTIISLKRTQELYRNNDEISKTINPIFLSENITSNLTKEQIEILSCYPNLQDKIVKLSMDLPKIKLIYELANKYKDNLEWIPIIEKALDNITSPEFANLLGSIQNIELEPKEKENLLILLMTNNHLDISTHEELKNINEIREKYINKLIERNTLGSLKTAYFEKIYGIDLSTAINLVNLYEGCLNTNELSKLDEQDQKTLKILANMKKIINLNNIYVLRNYINNINPEYIITPDIMITYEARLKYIITKEFNKSFTKPNEEDKVTSNIQGEEDLNIYLAAGKDGKKKCRMMITSIGAYTSMQEPDDYYASWNVDKIASHGCCCSYIGEKNLGTAEIKYCCLGFTDYEPGSLQLSAPYDLCSRSKEDSYQIQAAYPSMYLLPEDVLNHTRHTHNETVWERRNINGDKTFKKQPSYIVFFVDNFEDRLSDSEAMRQWESVKKAAKNFNLPIMVIEREKIAISQKQNIDQKLEEFKQEPKKELIRGIVSDYESNYAGNREYHPNISNKYFPRHDKLSDTVVGKVLETIEKTYETDKELAIECLDELEKVVKEEQIKYNNTQHGVNQSIPSFSIEETIIKINELKTSFNMDRNHTQSIVEETNSNTRQYEKTDKPTLSLELQQKQLSTEEVLLKIKDIATILTNYNNEIKEEHINEKLKSHGQRHIKNVLLYTLLIGKEVLSDEKDLELVAIAAKYHDVGRKLEYSEEHALPSALIAEERLKGKKTDEEIAIIKTIIEFHEVPRDHPSVESIFRKIAEKNNVPEEQLPRVRKLAEILKDADALDRTRFLNRARLNANYLKYDFSKQLVKFAATMQETYALDDLKQLHSDEAIKILLEEFTPQELLKIIRQSTKGFTTLEDIQTFIELWAESLKTKALNRMFEDKKPEEVQTNYGK